MSSVVVGLASSGAVNHPSCLLLVVAGVHLDFTKSAIWCGCSGSHRSEHSGGRVWDVKRGIVEGSNVGRRACGGEVVGLMQKHRT